MMPPDLDIAPLPPSEDPKWLRGCGSLLIGAAVLGGLCTFLAGPQLVPFTVEGSPAGWAQEFGCGGLLVFLILAVPGVRMLKKARHR